MKLFLIAAFFMLVSLSGCGIPSVLYLSTSDYTLYPLTQTDTTIGISNMSISSVDSKLDTCNGPNIIFCYAISNTLDDDSYYKNYPVSSFASQYIVNTYQGVPVSDTDNAKILDKDYSLSNSSRTNNLYLFSEQNESRQMFTPDDYVIHRTSTNIESLSNVSLKKTGTTDSDISINLSYASSSFETTDGVTQLYRYNGQSFLSSWKNGTNYTNNLDYALCTSESDPVYVYIYAAFCISPVVGSDFSNRFWSSLKCLGYLTL